MRHQPARIFQPCENNIIVAPAAVVARPYVSRQEDFSAALQSHHRRVGEMTRVFAAAIGMSVDRAEMIGRAAALHDVGKLFVSRWLFQKSGPLTRGERAEMQTHTLHGHAVLIRSLDPVSQLAARIALEHHEYCDGSGYPDGLVADEISLEARLVTICDVYDALREARPYKPGMNHDDAVATMVEGGERTRPEMFDPTLLADFSKHQDLFRDVSNRTTELAAFQ
jgi:putative two-component system response regulator